MAAGTRALDKLRDGVEHAIVALGEGFLVHPTNTELRARLRAGTLSTSAYQHQLLRTIYRMLFLLVAESRDLLLDPTAEWRQMFREAVRFQRDFFYVENVHGLDLAAAEASYAAWLPWVRHRDDLNYVLDILGGETAVGLVRSEIHLPSLRAVPGE